MVGAGELGTTPGELDDDLSRIFRIGSQWGSVALLDEADVFLEQRSLHDLARNALVAVFLRQLEYFPGLLFVTTNRVLCYQASGKGSGGTPITVDEIGAGLGCATMDWKAREVVVARDEAIYLCGTESRGACYAYEGTPTLLLAQGQVEDVFVKVSSRESIPTATTSSLYPHPLRRPQQRHPPLSETSLQETLLLLART